jgi:S1-C subfamily serine protease
VIQPAGDIQAILRKVGPAVVRINVTINGGGSGDSSSGSGGTEQGVGTGFIISSDGRIVTNAHVVENATSVQVQLAGGRLVTAHVLGASTTSDLAVIKIDGQNLPTVELGDSNDLVVGDQVVAIGNALGLEGAPTVTSGIVSGLHRVLQEPPSSSQPQGVNIPNTIQTDAAINPGNSGGPLVDASGKVIGINTAIADPSQSNNIGFAIEITPVKPVIAALSVGKQPNLAFLGVGTEAVTSDLATQQHLSVNEGAYVANVSTGSAAARGGIHVGDVIVSIDGQNVTSDDDVINVVRRHNPGDTIPVTVNRGGKIVTVTVTLQSKPS